MSSPASKASGSDDSSVDLLGTTAVKGHSKRRRMMTSTEVAAAASLSTGSLKDTRKKPRRQLSRNPTPPIKQSAIDPSIAKLAQSDEESLTSLDDRDKASNLSPSMSSKTVAVRRHPTPPRLTSTISSHVEALAGPPRVTDPIAFVAWSNATSEDQVVNPLPHMKKSIKKSIKAPKRADPKPPPRKQLMRDPRIPSHTQSDDDSHALSQDSDQSSKPSPSDEEENMDKKPSSNSSCKPPIGALPRTHDDDSDMMMMNCL